MKLSTTKSLHWFDDGHSLNIYNGLVYEKIENIEDASKNLNQLTEKKCNYELLQR